MLKKILTASAFSLASLVLASPSNIEKATNIPTHQYEITEVDNKCADYCDKRYWECVKTEEKLRDECIRDCKSRDDVNERQCISWCKDQYFKRYTQNCENGYKRCMRDKCGIPQLY